MAGFCCLCCWLIGRRMKKEGFSCYCCVNRWTVESWVVCTVEIGGRDWSCVHGPGWVWSRSILWWFCVENLWGKKPNSGSCVPWSGTKRKWRTQINGFWVDVFVSLITTYWRWRLAARRRRRWFWPSWRRYSDPHSPSRWPSRPRGFPAEERVIQNCLAKSEIKSLSIIFQELGTRNSKY